MNLYSLLVHCWACGFDYEQTHEEVDAHYGIKVPDTALDILFTYWDADMSGYMERLRRGNAAIVQDAHVLQGLKYLVARFEPATT